MFDHDPAAMASALRNGHANGRAAGTAALVPSSKRFSDVPASIDVPVQDQEDEAVEIDLENLVDDPTDLCDLFENEHAARTYWMSVALAYAKQGKIEYAIEMLIRGGNAMQNSNPKEKLSIVSCLCWMYLWKSREAPRVAAEGQLVSEAKTKEFYLQLATSTLNEALRINPAFPPLYLARGVLLLLRASLQAPSKSGGPGAVDSEKAELLRTALKSFDGRHPRVSGKEPCWPSWGGRGRCSPWGNTPRRLPDTKRCFRRCPTWWIRTLGSASAAASAARVQGRRHDRLGEVPRDQLRLQVRQHLAGPLLPRQQRRVPTNSPDFIRLYKKAMTEYTQKSFKLDKHLPLTCATFADISYPGSRLQTSTLSPTRPFSTPMSMLLRATDGIS